MAVNTWAVALVLMLTALASGYSNETRDFCPPLQAQKDFDVDELMRMWYVVEVLEHNQAQQGIAGAITRIDKCPVVHLQRLGVGRLKLLWDEMAGVVEYEFRLPIPYTPGYWVAEGPPKSTLSDKHGKHIAVQFSGDVHVMKAVASHLVLTFCSAAEEKLWTIVLSMDRSLSDVELRGVNKMLERRALPLSSIRQTCSGEASATAATILATIVLVAGISTVLVC